MTGKVHRLCSQMCYTFSLYVIKVINILLVYKIVSENGQGHNFLLDLVELKSSNSLKIFFEQKSFSSWFGQSQRQLPLDNTNHKVWHMNLKISISVNVPLGKKKLGQESRNHSSTPLYWIYSEITVYDAWQILWVQENISNNIMLNLSPRTLARASMEMEGKEHIRGTANMHNIYM